MNESSLQLNELVSSARSIVAFTGAGISTECGIPDFRSPDSAWKRHAPIPFAEFLASEEQRIEAWTRKFAMDDLYAGAQPGRGHHALASWARSGKLLSIITQNIDGLHQASGVPADKVIELHGNGTYATCLSCSARHELSAVRPLIEMKRAVVCDCGGLVKSATISFGQSMPKDAMQRAQDVCRKADLFLAIGSSLVVYPAAAFPVFAKECGADLVIINREPTPLDSHADLCLRGDIGDILAPFCTG
jgi:NAD-dependent deacetylase